MAASVATSQLCSTMLPPPRLASSPKPAFRPLKTTTASSSFVVCASSRNSYGHHYDGKMVDDNMIVLRMRIQEIEMQKSEKNEAPSYWMQWERMYFVNYRSDIFETIGLLQTLMMDTRPCLAVGILVLVMLSMSVSTSLVVFHLVQLAKWISGGQFCT